MMKNMLAYFMPIILMIPQSALPMDATTYHVQPYRYEAWQVQLGYQLLYEVSKGTLESIERLLGQGAMPGCIDKYGDTILHKASWRGDCLIMNRLLLLELPINARSNKGETPLHLAGKRFKEGSRKHEDIINVLLLRGADRTICDNEGIAAQDYFANEITPKEEPKSGNQYATRMPLHSAASGGHTEEVELLLKHKAHREAALKSRTTNYKQKGEVDQPVAKESESYSKKGQNNVQKKDLQHFVMPAKSTRSAVPATQKSTDTDNDRKLLEHVQNGNHREVKRLLEGKADVGVRDRYGDTPLHKAAWKLDAEMLELLLQYKADPQEVNNRGSTALDVLCKKLKDVLQKLDTTPLWPDQVQKIFANAQQCQRLLFQAGVLAEIAHFSTLLKVWGLTFDIMQNVIESQRFLKKVKARDDQKKALAEAFLKLDYTQFMQILIELGADINSKDEKGNTPFMNAFFAYGQQQETLTVDSKSEIERQERIKRYEKLLDFLLSQLRQKYPEEILHIALAYFYLCKLPDKVQDTAFKNKIKQCIGVFCDKGIRVPPAAMLSPFAICERKGPNGFALLKNRLRCFKDSAHYLDALVNYGADCNFIDNGGYTPLHRALQSKEKTTQSFLLKKGARLPKGALLAVEPLSVVQDRAVSKKYRAAIEECASGNGKGGMELLIELVKHGADCSFIDNEGNTALHFAAQYNGLEQTNFLLEHGCPVNQKNKNGVTPLFLTSTLTVIQALLRYGAAVNIIDNEGRNPMHAVCELLIKRDGKIGDTWKDIIALYNSKGLSLNSRDKQGKTPLMSIIFLNATSYEYKSTFNELIRLGADMHACDNRGWGLLHYLLALQTGHSPDNTIELLLLKGINPNVQNEDGDTPLHFVYRYPNRWRSKDTFKDLMMSYGAKPTIRNKKGQTPLEVPSLPLPVDSGPTQLMAWE